MKKLLLAALLLPMFCFAQVKPKTNDNTIVITDSKSDIEGFGRFLVVEGFEIDKLDKDLGYLTTKERTLFKNYGDAYSAKVVFSGNTIVITSMMSVIVNSKRQTKKAVQVYYTGLPTTKRSTFEKLLNIAQKYSSANGGNVKTERRK